MMKHNRLSNRAATYYFVKAAILTSLFVNTGCLSDSRSGGESGSQIIEEPTPNPVPPVPPLTSPERTICDPFNQGSAYQDRGLVGHLLYFDREEGVVPAYSGVEDFMQNAEVVPSAIYFDRLFIPTRPWDRPFVTQAGETITNSYGTPVYEYFALRLESQLKLAQGQLPGYYQIALMSDDGSTMSWKNTDGTESLFIDNDGDHSTKMKCSMEPVYLDQNSNIPFVLKYYQGPRYHISMVMMMRPMPDPDDADRPLYDPECDKMGNDRFFDSTQTPVAAKPRFYEILSRGWQVLENDNFRFPEQAANPCVSEEAPLVISAFNVETLSRNSVTLTWSTNLPSNGEILFKQIGGTATGTVQAENPGLQTSHRAVVTGLSPNTLYSFQAISRTSSGQQAVSDEKAIRTSR